MSRQADYYEPYGNEAAFEPAQMAPHSQDVEHAVLGSILINPDAYLAAAKFITKDDFFILSNAYIWEAMEALHNRQEVIDYVTVIEELRSTENSSGSNRLDDIGGAAYLTYISNCVGTSLHADSYAAFVERYSLRRRMLDASSKIAELARNGEDAYAAYEQGRQIYDKQASRRQARSGLRPMSQAVSAHFDRVEELRNNPNMLPGVPSGFTDLDKILHGFRAEDLILLAARPGVGKTALMLNIMANAARQRCNVALFSLEMSERQLIDRMISAETGIGSYQIRDGHLDDQEWRLYVEATGKISQLPVFIDDTPNLEVAHIRQKCLYLHNLGKLDFVMVDHMQLIGGTAPDEERMRLVGDNSWKLKMLAKELKVPVLVASQLSRAVEQRADKRPMLSDLSESGRLEQNADVVMFIYRDELYNESTERPNEADIIVEKHRSGATGVATLFFRKQLTQFANLKKTEVHLGDFEL